MTDQEKIVEAIRQAIDEVNPTLPSGKKISKDLLAPLYGSGGSMDSLSLALLIVAVEQRVEEVFHKTPNLAAQSMMGSGQGLFQNIEVLSENILRLISR